MVSKRKVYSSATLITEKSLQSSLLKDALAKSLNIDINILAINNLSLTMFSRGKIIADLVIIDMSVFSREKEEIYALCQRQHFSDTPEILINCNKKSQYEDFKVWSNLVGVFYISDDIELLNQGVEKILFGEMWLSRKLAQQYIQHFRRKNGVKTSVTYKQLTKREQQIIKLLGNGSSNIEIAEKLYVSENTVKTHLHNVFRKIKAKNRLQALLWAKENIGVEELT